MFSPTNGDRFWLAQPVLNDANIVMREVPESVDVGTDTLEDLLGKGEATSPGRDQIDTSIVVDLSIGTSRNRWSSRIGV